MTCRDSRLGCPAERSEAERTSTLGAQNARDTRHRSLLSRDRQHRARRVPYDFVHRCPRNMRGRFRGHCPVRSHHDQIDFELAAGHQDSLRQEIGSHDILGFLLQASFRWQTFSQLLEAAFARCLFPILPPRRRPLRPVRMPTDSPTSRAWAPSCATGSALPAAPGPEPTRAAKPSPIPCQSPSRTESV